MLKFMDLKGNKGITILTLTVTIIILLILAGISAATLTGDNGLIANAGKAKEQAEIDGEKEVLETATIQAMGKNKYGNVTQSELSEKLDTDLGEGKTEVIDNGDTLVVKFVDSKRYYEVDITGKTSEPITMIKDEYAGDLTKGGRCDGTEEKPYEINCIEDLVAFSIMTNGGNSEQGLASSNFSNKYVILTRSLDFKSIFSYNDYTTSEYGDLNTDGVVEDIKTELTKTDEGCIGFTPIGNNSSTFGGIFDGQGFEIENIFESLEGNGGLFGVGKNCIIKNISISGEIMAYNYSTGGIIGCILSSTIEDCNNSAKIIVYNSTAGGIAGSVISSNGIDAVIENCSNKGNIFGYGTEGLDYKYTVGLAGGIVGEYGGKIINCQNSGEIFSENHAGGIAGYKYAGKVEVYNSFNIGIVTAKKYAGGILGSTTSSNITIKNCYVGIGTLSGQSGTGGIQGYKNPSATLIASNNYYLESIATNSLGNDSSNIIGEKITLNQLTTKDTDMSLVNILNNNKDLLNTELDTIEWNKWILGENGYPTFE